MKRKLPFSNYLKVSCLIAKQLSLSVTLIILLFCSAETKAQTFGSLSGSVKTSDGLPAEMVTIVIIPGNKSTYTNAKGEFRFNKLSTGAYKVIAKQVGLQTQEKQIDVAAGPNTVNFSLSETAEKLGEVNIAANKTNKFATKKSDYVARMPLNNLENPQTYTSIGKAVLDDQVIVDYRDIFKNAPGVVSNNNPAGGTGGTIRGFNSTATVRNGLAVQTYQLDPINVERVEVIKGPSGTLFGSSIVSFGGLMNQVTKKPFDTLGGEIGLTIGKYELNRLTADFNTPLNADKTALIRINAAAHKENSFQNYGHKKMYTFAPSFIYKVNDKLTFNLEAELNSTNRSTVAYYQFAAAMTPGQAQSFKSFNDIPVPYETSLGGENIDAQLTATNIFAEAKYEISDKWTSTTSFAYGENQIEHSYQIYPQWTSPTTFNRNIFAYGPRIFTSYNGQQNFNGDFKIAGLRNRVLVGVNFYTFRSFLRFANLGAYDVVTIAPNTAIPALNLEKINTLMGSASQSNTESKQGSYSAYASDVINLTDRLMAMLSLRVDRFENQASVVNGVKAATGAYNQTAYSPKLGLIYQVLKDKISLFGNYMNGFQNVAPVTQPDGSVDTFKPRQANQFEGGAKFEIFGKRLNATLTYYDIKISNDTRADGTFTRQDATSRSKGYEAELIANPVDGLNIIAGYAKNDYKIINGPAALIGKFQAQVPNDYVNFWASYKFTNGSLKDFGLGFGGNYVSKCYFDSANLLEIPSYTVLNASIFYDQPKWRVAVKGNNLGNTKYWTNYGIPESLSQYLATLSFKF